MTARTVDVWRLAIDHDRHMDPSRPDSTEFQRQLSATIATCAFTAAALVATLREPRAEQDCATAAQLREDLADAFSTFFDGFNFYPPFRDLVNAVVDEQQAIH